MTDCFLNPFRALSFLRAGLSQDTDCYLRDAGMGRGPGSLRCICFQPLPCQQVRQLLLASQRRPRLARSPEALVLTLVFKGKADLVGLKEVPFAFFSSESHHRCNNLLLAVLEQLSKFTRSLLTLPKPNFFRGPGVRFQISAHSFTNPKQPAGPSTL